jgi:hypothetical protein
MLKLLVSRLVKVSEEEENLFSLSSFARLESWEEAMRKDGSRRSYTMSESSGNRGGG